MQSEIYAEDPNNPNPQVANVDHDKMGKETKEENVWGEEIAKEGEPATTLLKFSHQKGLDEHPMFVVFNGATGSLMKDGALKAKVGETVRIFFGNGGPNLISSFHVIGEMFDNVHREGSLVSPVEHDIQTTLVPAGGSTVVEFKLEVPGTFTLVDHSIFRIEKGAVGWLQVEGNPNYDIYASDQDPVFCPGCLVHP
jgi:hypothetical protein